MGHKIERLVGPDLIRAFAIVCVVCGHFFSVNTPYNDTSHAGGLMLLQGCLKGVFCYLGVPLFLMLTGYFNCKKEFSFQYYKNIKRILVPYLIISVITWGVLSTSHSVVELVLGTLGYKIIGYAWYVEMFIGLYLSVPFLNMIVEKVFTSNDKKMIYGLYGILIFMTSLPPLVDRGEYRLIPNYWQMCFPVLLHFTGAYIRYFQPIINRKVLAWSAIAGIYFLYPVADCLKQSMVGGGNFANPFGPYYALPGYIAMTMLFILLYKVDIRSAFFKKIVTNVSLLSYEMFLFSYLCDKLIYRWVMDNYYTNQSEFTIWFLPITVSVLVFSYILSYMYNNVGSLFKKKGI